jgi:cytochrome c553
MDSQESMQEEQEQLMAGSDDSPAGTRPALTPEQTRFFESKIRPVLIANCYSCHSQQSGRSEGGLDVDSAAALINGGESGPALDHDDFTESLLWKAINYDGLQMPPQDPLPPHVIEDFRQWLADGAPDPRVTEVVRGAYRVTPEKIEEARSFWSLQKLPPSSATLVAEAFGAANDSSSDAQSGTPIDRFVEQTRQMHALPAPPMADSYTVLRRLCFDLLGLPPTPQQIDWFQERWAVDPDQAVAQAVDLMLASDKFGERWGRHWLDIARFAESTGREVNMPYTEAWRYRDYVIDSFNKDKPYDRFLKEQLAGDLIAAGSKKQKQEQLIATGFLALGPKTLNERSAKQFEMDIIDEQIDVTTRSILGISVACARCHDHKFEAIRQEDYYALAGIFGNMTTHYGGANSQRNRHANSLIELPLQDTESALPSLSPRQFTALNDRADQAAEELQALRREVARERQQQRRRGGQAAQQNNNAGVADQQRRQQLQRMTTQLGSVRGVLDLYDEKGNPKAMCMGVQPKSKPTDARLLERGEVNQPGSVVKRGFVPLLEKNPPRIRPNSSGRMELANWIASEGNPLTARVMANRVWQHLIGEGIVRTPEDFGVTGAAPTHPELLDYLAVRFIENEWSIKSLIREIATSKTYRMGWQTDAVAGTTDPDNKYLWRSHPQRLEAEVLRDSLLFVANQLDLERPVGSLVAKAGPLEIGRGQQFAQFLRMASDTGRPARSDRNSTGDDASSMNGGMMQQDNMMSSSDRDAGGPRRGTDLRAMVRDRMRGEGMEQAVEQAIERRDRASFNVVALNEASINGDFAYRSIYMPMVRELMPRSLELFDAAEPSMVIGDREQSNTANQALYMLNNELVQTQARELAEQLLATASSPSQQIEWVYKLAYSRPATAEEVQQSQAFLNDMTDQLVAAAQERVAERNRDNRRPRRGAAGRNRRGNNPADTNTSAEVVAVVTPEIQRDALAVFCHAILASAEFRYRN